MLWITSNSNGSNSSMLFPRLTTALESQAPGSLDVVMLSEAQSITPRRVNAQREQLGLHRFNPFDYGQIGPLPDKGGAGRARAETSFTPEAWLRGCNLARVDPGIS